LLLAIHKKTGLVTFHGPLVFEPRPQFSVKCLKKTLFAPNKLTYTNPNTPPNLKKDIIQTQHITQTIQPGIATGHLVGGNLSVLVTLLGTPYEPDWNNTILFVEETGENNYRIDRMLSQLNNAGVFSKIKGFVFGECRQCKISSNDLGSFSLYSIIKKYTQPYHIPAYMGASFGHEPENFTLPIGVVAKMDATKGSIQLLHAAVSD
jgi:muramoyltetrapeptide carboxypeptidase